MLQEKALRLYKKFRLHHYRGVFSKVRERDGSLSATEAYAVDVIYLLGTPTLGEFADYLGLSQPNATYKVNNLMAKGYVTKSTSEQDRRECLLNVTDKFYSYYQMRDSAIDHAVEAVQKSYSEEQVSLFEEMMETFIDAME